MSFQLCKKHRNYILKNENEKKKPQTKSTSKTTECLSQIYACNKDFMHKCPMPWQQQLLYMTFT